MDFAHLQRPHLLEHGLKYRKFRRRINTKEPFVRPGNLKMYAWSSSKIGDGRDDSASTIEYSLHHPTAPVYSRTLGEARRTQSWALSLVSHWRTLYWCIGPFKGTDLLDLTGCGKLREPCSGVQRKGGAEPKARRVLRPTGMEDRVKVRRLVPPRRRPRQIFRDRTEPIAPRGRIRTGSTRRSVKLTVVRVFLGRHAPARSVARTCRVVQSVGKTLRRNSPDCSSP